MFSLSLSFIPITLCLPLPFCSVCLLGFVSRAAGCWRSTVSVCWTFSSCRPQTKHRGENVSIVCCWWSCTCVTAHPSLLPPPSHVSPRTLTCLLLVSPLPRFLCPLQSSCYLWCYSGTAREDGEGGKLSLHVPSSTKIHHPLFSSIHAPKLLLHPHLPFRPRSLVRLGSDWSHNWAHCKVARPSRSLHSCQWTWGPAGACWGHPAGGVLPCEPGSRGKVGPRSDCPVGEGFGREDRALRASLEKRSAKKEQHLH